MLAAAKRPAPIRAGEKVTQFPAETVQTVRAVEEDPDLEWAIKLIGAPDLYAADDLRPVRTINYYWVAGEGHMHLCVPCASKRRHAGEDVEFLSSLGPRDRWDCHAPDCNAVQLEKGFDC